jgi:hypothetical protein
MPTSERHDLLTQLRVEWQRLGRSSAARLALASLRQSASDVIPLGVRDLVGLVHVLEPDGGLSQIERARVVESLLCAADDPLLRRCLLQTLLPGIVAVARRLRFGDGVADSPTAFLGDALAEASDLLAEWAGQRRPFAAPDLLGALRCRLRRRMLADKQRRSELIVAPDRPSPDDPHAAGSFAHDLAVASHAGTPDLRLLYARCVLGVPACELAVAVGVSTGVLRRRLVTAAGSFLAAQS